MLKFNAATKIKKSEYQKNGLPSAVKLTKNWSGTKLIFAICPITTHSSKIVLVPIENSNNSYESTIADQKNTLIGNVDE